MNDLKEQNELLKALLVQGEKTRKNLLWMKILGILRLVIIVTPIVLAIIYLPPAVRKTLSLVPGVERIIQREDLTN